MGHLPCNPLTFICCLRLFDVFKACVLEKGTVTYIATKLPAKLIRVEARTPS